MAIRLKLDLGIEDVVVFERSPALGGTWWDNTYPGCACDIPAPLYSYSFAPKTDWSAFYAGHAEIRAYMEATAERFGVRDRIRTSTEVTSATWHEDAGRWRLATAGGQTVEAPILVTALGGLTKPDVPAIPGLADFGGPVFHSARWEHDVPLAGRRVAVIGTGASAIQFTPEVAKAAARVDVFQRTPPWILPKADVQLGPRAHRVLAHLPGARQALRGAIFGMQEVVAVGNTVEPRLHALLERRATAHLEGQIADPDLRRAVTPRYRLGCKRILVSNDWYPTLAAPHVELVEGGATSITETGVVGADGVERPADVILLGTGFRPWDVLFPLAITGREGRDLDATWRPGLEAHRGTTVAGFPNLFLLDGPNTGTGHQSQLYMIESQHGYVVDALRTMRRTGARTVEARPEAQAAYNAWIRRRMARTVWLRGGCSSWYLDERGRNVTLWPGFAPSFRRSLRRFRPAEYALAR